MTHALALSAHDLRALLMAPRAPDRVQALHALECEIGHVSTGVARELTSFTSRGIPYYAPEDAHYQRWVDKAVGLWERAHTN